MSHNKDYSNIKMSKNLQIFYNITMSQNICYNAIHMASLKQLKTQFLEYIEIEKGRAIRTVENYDHYLTVFIEQTKISDPKDITDVKVRDFRIWLNRQTTGNNRATGDTIKKKTQNYYLIALRSFLKFLAKRNIASLPADHIELAKIGERQIDVISQEELKRLLDAPNKEVNLERKSRDKAILEMLFSTGLRVSELCSLKNDLDLHLDEFPIRGKGSKVRVVFLSDEAKKAVKDYLALRKDMSEALFVETPSNSTLSGREDSSSPTKRGIGEGLSRRSIE